MLLNYYNSIVKVKDDLYVVFDCHFRANYSITGTCRELRDLFAHSKIMRDRISDCKANSPKMSGIEGLVFFERVVTCKRYLSVLSTSPTICKMCVHLQSIIDKILQNNGKFVPLYIDGIEDLFAGDLMRDTHDKYIKEILGRDQIKKLYPMSVSTGERKKIRIKMDQYHQLKVG